MARLFSTGFEESDIRAVWDFVNTEPASINAEFSHLFGYNDLITFAPRTGRGMYRMTSGTALRNEFDDTSNTELYFGFAIYTSSFVSNIDFFTAFTDSVGTFSSAVSLRLTATGAVTLCRTGTVVATSVGGVLTTDQWYYIEVWVKPLNVNGRGTVKVDGVTVIDYTGDLTSDMEYINGYEIGGVNSASSMTCFDDFVCNDTSGAVNNTWPGMVRLLPIRPHTIGTYQDWTRAGVDLGYDAAQARNGTFEFTMMQTADADDKETFVPELPDLPAGASITNIILSIRARVEAGAGVIAPAVISNATEDISADQTLISNWKYYQYAWALNPDDAAAWAEADLTDLEIGFTS